MASYFPEAQVDNALAVIAWESGGDPNAKGDTHLVCSHFDGLYQACLRDGKHYGDSHGLFQVRYLPGRPARDGLVDPEANTRYAAAMFKASGWCPWSSAHKMGLAKGCHR